MDMEQLFKLIGALEFIAETEMYGADLSSQIFAMELKIKQYRNPNYQATGEYVGVTYDTKKMKDLIFYIKNILANQGKEEQKVNEIEKKINEFRGNKYVNTRNITNRDTANYGGSRKRLSNKNKSKKSKSKKSKSKKSKTHKRKH